VDEQGKKVLGGNIKCGGAGGFGCEGGKWVNYLPTTALVRQEDREKRGGGNFQAFFFFGCRWWWMVKYSLVVQYLTC